MAWFTSPNDPVAGYLSDENEEMEVRRDDKTNTIKSGYGSSYLLLILCFIPCYIQHQLPSQRKILYWPVSPIICI